MDSLELQKLVWRSCKGDQEAFAAIVNLYKAYVFAVILNFVHERDEAENIAQEVFLQMYRSLPRYRSQNLKAWLGKIALNKALDFQRKMKKQSQEEFFTEEEELFKARNAPIIPRDDPEMIFLRKERQEQVEKVCLALPEVYRRTIEKYYLEEKSYQQIAAEDKITVKTVESRLYRAKKLFREKWEEG